MCRRGWHGLIEKASRFRVDFVEKGGLLFALAELPPPPRWQETLVQNVREAFDDGRARRWPGGYAGWLTDREGSSNVRTLDTSGPGTGSASPRARSEVAYRSRSTVRHELKTAEKAIAKLETVVAALRDELEVAGTDHEAIARVGTELAAQELALAAAEEAWLERSAELEEIDGVG